MMSRHPRHHVNEDGNLFDRVNTSWRGLLKSANIKGFGWRNMRHHFASRLVLGGVDLLTVRRLLIHSDNSTKLCEAHLNHENKINLFEVLDLKYSNDNQSLSMKIIL